MNCEIVKVAQNSDEWLALRRGRITASRLADVCAKPETQRYQEYRKQKVLELLGHEFTDPEEPWFAHGRAMEPRAIAAYEFKYGVQTEHDVMLIHPEYDWLSCSPDMLHVTDDGDFDDGVEIKARQLYKNYRMHRQMANHFEGTPKAVQAAYRHQVQGAMWVTGQQRWGYCNYYEGEDFEGKPIRKLHSVWVPRDDELIERMEVACLEFMHSVYELAGVTA